MTLAQTRPVLIWAVPACRDNSRREYIFSQPIFGDKLEAVGTELLRELRRGKTHLFCQRKDDYSLIAERQTGMTWANLEYCLIFPSIEKVIRDHLHLAVSLPERLPY